MRSARKKSSRLPAIRLVESPHPRENPVAYRSAASLLRRLRPGNKGPPLLRRRDRALAAWGRWIRWMRWEGVARRPPPVLTRARANTRANVTEAGLRIRAQVQTAGRLARASPPPPAPCTSRMARRPRVARDSSSESFRGRAPRLSSNCFG
jgi:hypothetical protein